MSSGGKLPMGIISSPITPTRDLKRNPKRLHSMRYYLLRRGKQGRSIRNSYKEQENCNSEQDNSETTNDFQNMP